jgi:ATP-binding cassette, subfamily B, bacterial
MLFPVTPSAEPGPPSRLRRLRTLVESRVDLLSMLRSAPRSLVSAAVAVSVVAGLLPVGLILAGGLLSNRIAEALAAGTSRHHVGSVYAAFALVMALFLAAQVMVPVQSRVRWLLAKRVDGVIRARVMRASLTGTDLTRLHSAGHLEAMGQVSGLVRWSATPGGGAAGVVGVASNYLTGFAAAVVLGVRQPLLALLTLVVALAMRVRWRREILAIVDRWQDGRRDRSESQYLVELGLGRVAASEVRLFGLRDWLRQRITAAGVRSWVPSWRQRRVGMGTTALIELAGPGVVSVVVLVWAARAAAHGTIDVGDLVIVVPALFAVLGIGRTFPDDMAVQYGLRTVPAIRLLEEQAEHTAAREPTGGVRPSANAPTVELHGVSFAYPEGAPVLRAVDLTFAAGTSTALVGVNGAGKTTLLRLLCGLYPPTTGQITVDGVDLRELDLGSWQRLNAVMFQGFLRLPVSVFENVAVGSIENATDTDSVRAALLEADAASFADRLPEGMDSQLSTSFSDGTDVSGGQWQRLAIARALQALNHGAAFLMLDEPTSNLDTASEERLVRRLVQETRGRATTLLITHRLALARRCDQIVVLDDGHVAEQGSHDDLIQLGGRYAAAFGMQASMYPLEAIDG